MKAMVLAAGRGERLMPLTNKRPKCLMPVMNRPLLGLCLERLARLGITQAVVNTHHLAPQVSQWLGEQSFGAMAVSQSHEPQLLGTGGALVAAREHLDDGQPFLVVNADVLHALDLAEMIRLEELSRAFGVMALTDFPAINSVAVDPGGRVQGFRGRGEFAKAEAWLTYTGLGVFSPEIFDFLPPQGPSSLIDALVEAMAAEHLILGLKTQATWRDLGQVQAYWAAHRDLARGELRGLEALEPGSPVLLAEGAVVEDGATVEGFAVLGDGARIQAGARVRDSVLLPGAVVEDGATVEGAVLGDGFTARGELGAGAHA